MAQFAPHVIYQAPPEGFKRYQIIWVEDFSHDEQTTIQERLNDALQKGDLEGCSWCRVMQVRVYRGESERGRFQALLDCSCGRLTCQNLDGETFRSSGHIGRVA